MGTVILNTVEMDFMVSSLAHQTIRLSILNNLTQ